MSILGVVGICQGKLISGALGVEMSHMTGKPLLIENR